MTFPPYFLLQRFEQVTFLLFCMAAAVYPFSVAATNIALGSALIIGIVTGQFTKGLQYIWHHHRALGLVWVVYLMLLPVGLIWSPDRSWGLHIVARQWYWLLIPLAVTIFTDIQRRQTFLAVLSASLTLHLVFCVAQWLGLTGLIKGGSSATNPTGHIGHIGFGFVYGVWAAWLLNWGWCHTGRWRVAAWLAATIAWFMIFLAQGRGGYLIAFILLLVVSWKIFQAVKSWKVLGMACALLLLMLGTLATGAGRDRILGPWLEEHAAKATAIAESARASNTARWNMAIAALNSWRQHPVIGVGTGGFPTASARIAQQHPELDYGGGMRIALHPHNMYLLVLARWGVPGMIALVMLFFLWVKTGWNSDWRNEAASLIALPGIAMAVHGLFAPGMEEHFSGILAALLLGAGLAATPSPCDGQSCASTSDV